MDIATVGGLAGSFVIFIIVLFIGGNDPALYFDAPSILITVIGSFCAVLMGSPLGRITGDLAKYLKIVFNLQPINMEIIITQIVGYSETARKEGLLSLDDAVNDIEDEFIRNGMRMVVDGTDSEIVKKILYAEMAKMGERHETGIAFFSKWSSLAPAFGMIGTLIGLVGMMANLDDLSSVGPNMAVALITTLYGSMLANMVLIPMSSKLEDRNSNEMLMREIVIEGILSIQSGDNPKLLEQKLYSFLPPAVRPSLSD